MIQQVNISLLKENPINPRSIKQESLELLKKSLQEFPEMLYARPIIVDENFIILGGNMRFKAAKELKMKKVWVHQITLTEDKKKEFIIKDNTSNGMWDYEHLTFKFDSLPYQDWGLSIPEWFTHTQDITLHEAEQRFSDTPETLILEYNNEDWNSIQEFIKKNKIKLEDYLIQKLT